MKPNEQNTRFLTDSALGRGRFSFDVPVWCLVAANLFPLAGVIFFDWDAAIILVVYWAENLVVGFYSVLRIIFAHAEEAGGHVAKLFLVPFFLIHFGGFCAIHGMFVFVFTQGLGENGPQPDMFPDSDVWWGPLIFVGLLVSVIDAVWSTYSTSIWLPITALLISHGVSFVVNYLLRGEYRTRDAKTLMAAPYGRIVLMHFAIIAAGLPVMLLGSPTPLLVILVGLKMVTDVLLHQASHRADSGKLLAKWLRRMKSTRAKRKAD